MAEEMTDLAISISGKALFNVDFGSKAAELGDALVTVLQATRFNNLALASKQFEKISLPSHRRFARAAKKLDTEIRAMIAERRKGACEDPDLLSVMMRLHKQSRKGITEQKIRDQIMTFFMVGNETPATGSMWTWYLLAENPEVATKLHDEVDHVLGDRLPSGQDFDRLRYTRMVFAESMRLYPPVWLMTRRAVRDTKINGFVIQERLFACVFTKLRSVVDARCFGHSAFAVRYTELSSFAAETLQTVENGRETISLFCRALPPRANGSPGPSSALVCLSEARGRLQSRGRAASRQSAEDVGNKYRQRAGEAGVYRE